MTDNIALLTSDLPNDHATQVMHWAIADSMDYLKAGMYDRARRRITDSVLGEQARCAGIRVELLEEQVEA